MPDLTAQLPSALRKAARWERLGEHRVPVMLVHPDWDSGRKVPVILWMHGRTVSKEIDPGRYLRWMRTSGGGIGACAIDLPGHGERFDAALQEPERTFEVVSQMEGEIDSIVAVLEGLGVFDTDRLGIGGMSGGGMATVMRLTKPHRFLCASVEATSGSWEHQKHRAMFRDMAPEIFNGVNPIRNLETWRPIPFQAIHAKGDEWISIEGQREFVEALRSRYHDAPRRDPRLREPGYQEPDYQEPGYLKLIEYENTGAPYEHAGFGRFAADAKNQQTAFFRKWLIEEFAAEAQRSKS